jgi:hypothetical protein
MAAAQAILKIKAGKTEQLLNPQNLLNGFYTPSTTPHSEKLPRKPYV